MRDDTLHRSAVHSFQRRRRDSAPCTDKHAALTAADLLEAVRVPLPMRAFPWEEQLRHLTCGSVDVYLALLLLRTVTVASE